MNLVQLRRITDGQKSCDMLQAAAGLCADWEAGFPWDTARIIQIRVLIEAEHNKLNCK
jgi:hypothetical protein